MKKTKLVLIISLLVIGCTDHIKLQHMEIEEHSGFLNKYVWTGIKGNDGKIIAGTEKLTICPGYAGVISDTMRNAAIVAGAYFIGQGLGDSGDTSSSNTRINNGSNSSAVASPSVNVGANASAGAGSVSLSGASAAVQPKPHHYRELKPHEHGYYGID